MKHHEKYDPEDIESLLRNKQFYELYPEEREFVLKHMEDEQEYNRLRRLLLEIQEISASDDLLNPDASIRKNLLHELRKERKSRFVIWLNAVFAAPEIPWWKQSGIRIAFGLVILLLGFGSILLLNDKRPIALAENNQSENVQPINENDSLIKKEIIDEQIEPIQEVEISVEEIKMPEKPIEIVSAEIETIQEDKFTTVQNDMSASAASPSSREVAENYAAESEEATVERTENNTASPTLLSETIIKNEVTSKKGKSKASATDASIAVEKHSDLLGLLFVAR